MLRRINNCLRHASRASRLTFLRFNIVFPLLAAVLSLSAAQHEAGAAFNQLQFLSTPTPSAPGSVTFGPDGSLSITAPLTSIQSIPAAGSPGPLVTIANGSITFSLGPVDGGSSSTGYSYLAGGSMTIAGQLPGESAPEALFSMSLFNSTDIAYSPPLMAYLIDPQGAIFRGSVVSSNLKSEFGLSPGQSIYLGNVFAAFSGSPGGGNGVLIGVEVNLFVGNAIPAPGPGSAVMVAIGVGIVAGMRLGPPTHRFRSVHGRE